MYRILRIFRMSGLLMMIGLVGCSTYGNDFDCPVPKDGIRCQSISSLANKTERDLTADTKVNNNVIYVRG